MSPGSLRNLTSPTSHRSLISHMSHMTPMSLMSHMRSGRASESIPIRSAAVCEPIGPGNLGREAQWSRRVVESGPRGSPRLLRR